MASLRRNTKIVGITVGVCAVADSKSVGTAWIAPCKALSPQVSPLSASMHGPRYKLSCRRPIKVWGVLQWHNEQTFSVPILSLSGKIISNDSQCLSEDLPVSQASA